jgi:nitrate/nitrite transporter NarK
VATKKCQDIAEHLQLEASEAPDAKHSCVFSATNVFMLSLLYLVAFGPTVVQVVNRVFEELDLDSR